MKTPLDYLKQFKAKLDGMSYNEINDLLSKYSSPDRDVSRYAMLEISLAGSCYVFMNSAEVGKFNIESNTSNHAQGKQIHIDLASAA